MAVDAVDEKGAVARPSEGNAGRGASRHRRATKALTLAGPACTVVLAAALFASTAGHVLHTLPRVGGVAGRAGIGGALRVVGRGKAGVLRLRGAGYEMEEEPPKTLRI
ncbi:hypothetical protein T484DRAFT_1846984 [Baffinella frigidus]|nr:hypothetical protein T484DRAFT_1846984 [Cryptophyta sp. CCMP2293]